MPVSPAQRYWVPVLIILLNDLRAPPPHVVRYPHPERFVAPVQLHAHPMAPLPAENAEVLFGFQEVPNFRPIQTPLPATTATHSALPGPLRTPAAGRCICASLSFCYIHSDPSRPLRVTRGARLAPRVSAAIKIKSIIAGMRWLARLNNFARYQWGTFSSFSSMPSG